MKIEFSLFSFALALLRQAASQQSQDGRLKFKGLAYKYGHRALEYNVTTEDGYILTLFRFPGRSQYPVFLQHGVMDTADTWIIRGANSLSITLANKGYDVWIGNSRGNRYSRGHVSYDLNSDAYWNWSFHELGYYDLPAVIDFILEETGNTKVTAIGHSRGTAIFYILGATRPEYNSKIQLFVALAPIAFLQYVKPPVSTFLDALLFANNLYKKYNNTPIQIFDDKSIVMKLARGICLLPVVGPDICLNNIFFALLGYDPAELEQSFVYTFIYHYPAGDSWKSFVHFAQIHGKPIFRQYDYGPEDNLKVYHSAEPPNYNLSQITMPIALIAGRNDRASTIPDVEHLRQLLPNVVYYLVNPRAIFNHLDDIWGKHMQYYLYPYIFQILTKYNEVYN